MNTSDISIAIDEVSTEVKRLPINLSVDGKPILCAQDAATFFSRLRGLHAILPMAADEALILRPCNSIHTFTMRKPIDVVFLSKEGVILEIYTVGRWRWLAVSGAAAVIEMNAGVCRNLGIEVGDQIHRDSGDWT